MFSMSLAPCAIHPTISLSFLTLNSLSLFKNLSNIPIFFKDKLWTA